MAAVIDFRETAPLAATANMYLDRDGNVMRSRSTKGYLAAAIRLARDGFVLTQGEST